MPESYVDPAPANEDVDHLVATWDANAPEDYRGLLEAPSLTKLSQTGEDYAGRWVWDDRKGQYIDRKTGRPLSNADLHRVFSAFVESFTRRRGRNA